MKKVEANRYPHSATLFRFCKEALEIRYEGNVKVIDQDVGAILGYDPADCSHWKKGKKNIRSLATLRSIADHLNIDERLLIDITAGRIGFDEAVFEYKGYGAFSLQGKSLETLKKEYFKNPNRWKVGDASRSFEELFDVNRPAIATMAAQVLSAGTFTEAPIYIPEVLQLVPEIQLRKDDAINESIQVVAGEAENQGRTTINYKGNEVRPYMRYLLAREMFNHLVRVKDTRAHAFVDAPDEVRAIQANLFAGLILVPGELLRREVDRIDSSLDIVMQLAETFWVSKAFMNQRLRDYLEYLG